MAQIFTEGDFNHSDYEPHEQDLSWFSPLQRFLFDHLSNLRIEFFSAGIAYSKLGPEHLPLYMQWFNDEKVRRNLSPSTPSTEEEILVWLEEVAESSSCDYLLISVGGKPIGHIGIKKKDPEGRTAEVSLVIGDSDFLGSGIGFEIISDIIVDSRIGHDLDSFYILRNRGVSGANIFNALGLKHYVVGDFDVYVFQHMRNRFGEEAIPFDPAWLSSSQ